MKLNMSLVSVCLLLAISSDATAQDRLDEIVHCADPNPDVSIKACTALIKSGKEKQPALGTFFEFRGISYTAKQQYSLAIKDFDESVRINPNNAEAVHNRGIAKRKSGDTLGADADLAPAKILDPKYNKVNRPR